MKKFTWCCWHAADKTHDAGSRVTSESLDKHSHTAPHPPWCLQSQGLISWACKSSTIVPRAGFHPKIGMIWCWMMDERRRILYFICSGLMRLRLWCRVSWHVSLLWSRWVRGSCSCDAHLTISPPLPLPRSISDHQRQRRRGRVFRVHTIKI